MSQLLGYALGGVIDAVLVLVFYAFANSAALRYGRVGKRAASDVGIWSVVLTKSAIAAVTIVCASVSTDGWPSGRSVAFALGGWLTATLAGFFDADRTFARDGIAARSREWMV